MERLGEMLVEMRHAPDPRLLLEVALVQLTHPVASNDTSVLLDRVARLEQQVAAGQATASARPAPVDPATGRAALGGRARAVAPVATSVAAPSAEPAPPAVPSSASSAAAEQAVAVWAAQVMPALKSLPRAIYAATRVVGVRDGKVAVAAPNEAHRLKCQQHLGDVEAALAKLVGAPVKLVLSVYDGDDEHNADDATAGDSRGNDGRGNDGSGNDAKGNGNVVQMKRPLPPPVDEEEVDLNDLVDAPPETVVSPVDRLAQAFPGSQVIDE
jgi:DNA polymerase-3 subunit gamma/tau